MSEVSGRHDPVQGPIVHEYDGIEEADNQLPQWWVAVFLGTVAFGIAYWFGYEVYAARPTPAQEYRAEQEALQRARLEEAASAGAVSDDALRELARDPATLALGAATFKQICATCHGERAEGKIGPNLTDNAWLHGPTPLDIHRTVDQGIPAKGMPAWGQVLGAVAVRQAAAYVLSLRNTNVPGKEPQGTAYVEP